MLWLLHLSNLIISLSLTRQAHSQLSASAFAVPSALPRIFSGLRPSVSRSQIPYHLLQNTCSEKPTHHNPLLFIPCHCTRFNFLPGSHGYLTAPYLPIWQLISSPHLPEYTAALTVSPHMEQNLAEWVLKGEVRKAGEGNFPWGRRVFVQSLY